jgi:heterodisulfide reductase subunit D
MEERLSWANFSGLVMDKRVMKKADLAYFVGCQASYSGKMNGIAPSVVKILRKARENFTILGAEEWCCGSPIFLAGGYSVGKNFAKHNLDQLKKLGVKRIVTACAGCYRAFKVVYPRLLGEKWDFEILHISELVNELLEKGKIRLKKEIKEKITFKDPCELIRHCGLIETPREIIKKIPNIRFEELPSNRDAALCCGGGGLLKLNNAELVEQVNSKLMAEIVWTEADIVANGCPTCLDTILAGVRERNLDVEVLDITELILRAMGEDK